MVDYHSAVDRLSHFYIIFIIVMYSKRINLVIGHTATALFTDCHCLVEYECHAIVQILVLFGIRYSKEFIGLGSFVQICLNCLLKMFCSFHNVCYFA